MEILISQNDILIGQSEVKKASRMLNRSTAFFEKLHALRAGRRPFFLSLSLGLWVSVSCLSVSVAVSLLSLSAGLAGSWGRMGRGSLETCDSGGVAGLISAFQAAIKLL